MRNEKLESVLRVLFPNEAASTYARAAICIIHELQGGTDEIPECLEGLEPNTALVYTWHKGCKSLSPNVFEGLEEALKQIALRQYEAATGKGE